jgi:hypothetical protein
VETLCVVFNKWQTKSDLEVVLFNAAPSVPEPDDESPVRSPPVRAAQPAPIQAIAPAAGQLQSIFCHHCGNPLAFAANFCPLCGTKQQDQ